MRRLPNFYLLRAFEAAARLQSFSLAAHELSVTPSAVSHQVRELEEQLGCQLFVRSHRRIELSAEGRRFRERLSPALDALQEACDSVSPTPAKSSLTIYCSPSYAVKWLGPRLPNFVRGHPEVSLRLLTAAERPDLVARTDIDVAIVYADGTAQPGIVTEPLGRERIAPLCPPALAASISTLADGLPSLTLIESQLSPVKWSDWCVWHGFAVRGLSRFSVDRAALAIAAAVDGVGVALESTTLAERELARGDLVELPGSSARPIERTVHFLCYREVDRTNRSLHEFRDWLHAHRAEQPQTAMP